MTHAARFAASRLGITPGRTAGTSRKGRGSGPERGAKGARLVRPFSTPKTAATQSGGARYGVRPFDYKKSRKEEEKKPEVRGGENSLSTLRGA